MAIVCGTDFSACARQSATAAATLAARLGEELHVVHALAATADQLLPGSPQAHLVDPVRKQLDGEAARLRALGAEVTAHLVLDAPDDALLRVAEEKDAWLIVVGSLGKRGAKRILLGSTSERTALESKRPVLVIRGADFLTPWLSGERPLRITLGADFTSATDAAVRWLERLTEIGPCVICVKQVVWPPEIRGRYGVGTGYDLVELPDEARQAIERELRGNTRRLEGKAELHYEVRPGFGQPAAHLVQLAQRDDADILVVGSHQRKGLERLRLGSVSFGVLHQAPMSVLIVPPRREVDLGPVPQIRRVLAATDFSPLGDTATRLAYAQLPAGGLVHLVHVVDRAVTNPVYAQYALERIPAGDSGRAVEKLGEALRARVPAEAEELGIATTVEVIESKDVAAAIAQAAERWGADVICLATHGRTGLRKALLGSVAQGVLQRTHRPVLLVRPPRD